MKKVIPISVAAIFVVWGGMWLTDFLRVSDFYKPIFCVLDRKNCFDDGGSGTYRGLGYSFQIHGNFLPEAEYPGVTKYESKIFGKEVSKGIRD